MSTKPKTKSSITRTARTILEKDAFTFHQSTLNGMIQQIISNKRGGIGNVFTFHKCAEK